jgi:hypothetical protein
MSGKCFICRHDAPEHEHLFHTGCPDFPKVLPPSGEYRCPSCKVMFLGFHGKEHPKVCEGHLPMIKRWKDL